MKQLRQDYRGGAPEVVEAPAPRALPGRILVATRASLISSGTERQILELAQATLAGKAAARPDLVRQVVRTARREGLRRTAEKVRAKLDDPAAPGYSLAGEVLEIGRGVAGLAVGDRVACAGAGFASHAEINAVPRNLCARIPKGVSDTEASFATVGAIALQGVRRAAPALGERVAVSGLGLLGLLTVQLLKANGCQVLGYDPDPARAALARELGAEHAVSADLEGAAAAFTGGAGADAVIVTAATRSSAPVNAAAAISRLGGRVVLVGLTGMEIDRDLFYRRELDLRLALSTGPGRHDPDYEIAGRDYPLPHVRWTGQRNMEAFLDLVASGRLTPAPLVSHRFAIANAAQAYHLLGGGGPHLAILLDYPAPPRAAPARHLSLSRTATDTRPGVGFIGFGSYARGTLLPALRAASGTTLTAVVTSRGLSARSAADSAGFARAATEPGAVLEDPGTQAVVIATRHDSHAGYAAAALRAGKHVFCEKPLALDREGLDAVRAAAAEAPGLLTVGFNRRFAPLMGEMKAALAGMAGPLQILYRVNAGPLPPESWIHGTEGGGRLLGECCHFLDAMAHLAGAPAVSVQAVAASGAGDVVSALLRFADGSTGALVYAPMGDPALPKEQVEVFAAGRALRLEDFTRLEIAACGRRKVLRRKQDKGQRALMAAFVAAIREGGAPPIPEPEIFAATEASLALEQAVRTGRAVPLQRQDGT
ncbi:bi-domain-containing oxidoreductase [Rhodosalinus sp. K401]|uniref:bi-domain-containing oxidoreductase n=1 Tax=Rhodosalinus sp. K401 TaxID=3239195 RepID=UPI003523FC14